MMPDSNTPLDANRNERLINASTNHDETGLTASSGTNLDGTSIPDRRTTSTQTDPVAHTHENYQINRSMEHASSISNLRRFPLGRTLPYCVIPESKQNRGRTNHIAGPMAEINISDLFSTSISVPHPDPRESEGEQDTQRHNMPMPVILRRSHRDLVTIDENNSPRIDARASTNAMPDDGSSPPTDQLILREDTTTRSPAEHPHDTEFSVDTNDTHSADSSNVGNKENAPSGVYENVPTINNGNNLSSIDQGRTRIDAGAAICSNETSVVTNPTAATGLPPASSLQATEGEPNVQNPAIREAPVASPSILSATKAPNSLVSSAKNVAKTKE